MTGDASFLQAAVDKDPDGPFQASQNSGFLKAEKGKFPRPAGTAEGGGGIIGIQISGYRKDKRYQIPFLKVVLPEQGVVQGRYPQNHVLRLVEAPGCAP
jgi:hypothetical protein